MLTQEDKQHLQWIHDRIVNVYKESENVDFLWALRRIIKKLDADVKTQTEVYYERVEDPVFDLKDEFERGELYYLPNVPDNYKVINTEHILCNCAANKKVYRKVEEETWKYEAREFICNANRLSFDHPLSIISKLVESEYGREWDEEYLELCRVILRAKGELK